MVTNSSITIYHKSLNTTTRLEKWTRQNYEKVWFYGGKGAGISKGYENANDVEIRIPLPVENDISLGDIVVKGTLTQNITKQQDLKNYEIYNITSIVRNEFGNNPHIHLGGK